MHAVTMAEPKVELVNRPDGRSRVRSYFGTVATIADGPQAFLAELLDAGFTINPHFHDVDQFQIIVGGDGTIGKDELRPVAFHYADAYTPYGPIIARQDGLAFFTLRLAAAGGHFEMPGSKHLMKAKPGRNVAGIFEIGQPLPGVGETQRVALVDPRSDGLEVFGLRLGKNARAPSAAAAGGGGQYCLVCSGSLVGEGKMLAKLSLILVDRHNAPQQLEAGPEGAEVLVLQFPRPSERLGSDPSQLAGRDPDSQVMPSHVMPSRH